MTDRRAGPAGMGRGPQQGTGCPERLSPAKPTQAPSLSYAYPVPARHSPALPSGTARKLIPGLRSCPRASRRDPEQAMELRAARGLCRAKVPPLRTLGNVVRIAPSWGGGRRPATETRARGLVTRGAPQVPGLLRHSQSNRREELQSSSLSVCDSQGTGGWRWEPTLEDKVVCVCVLGE